MDGRENVSDGGGFLAPRAARRLSLKARSSGT